ncbi:MAG: gamma-glutamyl-gamma-aminobutyrate hydrolase family protein, partial [Gammaproteobacteria bacterium]
MNRPIVGITTYGRGESNRYSLPAEYTDSVRRAGGVPILLPPGGCPPADWLNLVDALVLSGGGDIDPARYGGGSHETLYNIDHERDSCEFEVIGRALDMELPLLAICRGMQVLNVHLGGTLHEHLPDVYGETVLHRAPPREPIPHALRILPDTYLASLIGEGEIQAASWHHQGIKTLGHDLQPAAYAPDGLVEACELPGHPWLIAVQWHPELTAAT